MQLNIKDIHNYIANHPELWDSVNKDTLFGSAINDIDENAKSDSVLGALIQVCFTACNLYEATIKAVKEAHDGDTIIKVKDAISAVEKQYAEYETTIKNMTSSTSQ